MSPRLARALASLLLIVLLVTGCVPSASVRTARQYALARRADGRLAVVAADDPLYDRFDQHVLSDPALHRLLMVFEHTTESFLATNGFIPAPRTVANHLVIVLDSEATGVLRDVRLATPGGEARVELALGLGRGGAMDLEGARHRLAAAMGPLLLELVGRRPPSGFSLDALAAPEAPLWPEEALWAGYALALEAEYAGPFLGLRPLGEALYALNPPPADLLARQAAIAARAEGRGGGATRAENVTNPSAVAALIVALHRGAGNYYPQRHMLWMVSYEAEEVPYGKVLLAMMRLPRGTASVEAFIASYAETYPAERQAVYALADAVLGHVGGGE